MSEWIILRLTVKHLRGRIIVPQSTGMSCGCLEACTRVPILSRTDVATMYTSTAPSKKAGTHP